MAKVIDDLPLDFDPRYNPKIVEPGVTDTSEVCGWIRQFRGDRRYSGANCQQAASSEKVSSAEENVLVFSSKNKIFVLDHDGSQVEIAERPNVIRALCSHAGMLYDVGDYNQILETLSSKVVAERSSTILALCSHAGMLYDVGRYNQIQETLSGKVVAERSSKISAL